MKPAAGKMKKVTVKKSKPAPKTKYGAAGSIWSKMKGDVL